MSSCRATNANEYRPQQEIDKNPSARYMAVQQWAVALTAYEKDNEQAVLATAQYIANAERWARRAMELGWGDPLEKLRPRV